MERMIIVSVACLFIQITCVASLPTMTSEARLIKDLLSSYSSLVKASQDENGGLNVSLGLQIIRLDGWENSALAIRAWVKVIWRDQRLSWDPDYYDGLKDIRLPVGKIWTPDLYLYNDAGSDPLFPENWRAVIYSDGNILFIPSLQLKSTCIYDDDHKNEKGEKFSCKLKFGSWTYSADKLDLFPEKDTLSLDNYSDTNAEWKITRADATKNVEVYPCCPESYVDVTYRVRMKRKN